MEASGVDEEIGRNTLKGLEGVWVYVFDLDENEKRVGFSKTALLAEVELRLRMAGIKVLTRKEMAKTPGLPRLRVSLEISDIPGDRDAFGIIISLFQAVELLRNPSQTLVASTWAVEMIGTGDPSFIRDTLKGAVDRFINAWLSVNPRPEAMP